jgi:PD-(D/E)XK nuclease superfamily
MAKREFSEYISASQINTFLQCPLKYKIQYSGDVVRLPPNLYIMFGTAIHHVLEENYRQKISSRVDLPIRWALQEFNDFYVAEAFKEL